MKHFYFSPRFSLLAILLMFLFTPVSAQYFYHGGIAYWMTDDNTAEVSYTYGEMSGVVEIPSVVTTIVEPMYSEPYEATVTITGVGAYAFEYCSAITEVILPNTIRYIGSSAFYNCNSLTKINLPNSLTSIGGTAFGYTALKSVVVPESVTDFGWNVFYSCENLTDVTLPSKVTALNGTFMWCTALKNVIIPNTVTQLNCTFKGCTSLNNIIIPGSVTLINDEAFYRCNALDNITCLATIPPTMYYDDCFYSQSFDIYSTAMLYVPKPSVESYKNAEIWKLFSHIKGIGEGVPGDVNGDNEVNIADVNAIISMILSDEYSEAGDINGDGEVNIADVNAVINIILS